MSKQVQNDHFSRDEVLELLNAAQVEVGRRYADTPHLREYLLTGLQQGKEDCDERHHMQILHEQMRDERRGLDAYNKHRMGKAAHHYYKNMPKSKDDVEYDEADNIPEQLEWFPLRNIVAGRGINVTAEPIYQLPGTVEHNQEFSGRTYLAANTISAQNTPPAKAADDKDTPSKKKTGRAASNYDKLVDAPSAYLGFPRGNITLAELTAFLPQSIKSWDVIDRALFNGAMSVTFAGMINHFRVMPNGPIGNNSIYRMMKGPMDKRALQDDTYDRWSVSAHQKLEMPDGFDPSSVSVAGFRTPINYNKREAAAAAQEPAPTILFRDLIKGVKVMPSGHDALDLTRCVQYSIDHPEQDWYYPQDFEQLVSQLPPSGPADVQHEHYDASAIARYTPAQKLKGALQTMNRRRDDHGRLLKQNADLDQEEDATEAASDDSDDDVGSHALGKKGTKRKRAIASDDSDDEDMPLVSQPAKRKKHPSKTPSRRMSTRSTTLSSRQRQQMNATGSVTDSDSDSDVYQSPTKKKRKVSVPKRTSGRTQRYSGSYDVDAASESDEEMEKADEFESGEEIEDV
ncbi:hypothetical protein N0V83_009140 [Neocucurbitaria cava]|uniref:Uncharacterized protein n=1 Tax=Neocucurbitaria cava TaxID=798079 RepID=A0A9W9CHW9_9PLEO|nr:hypothetical protein N0V83_009140 [Neocucurbitaria cava]